jgi:hypothetical protein
VAGIALRRRLNVGRGFASAVCRVNSSTFHDIGMIDVDGVQAV